MHDSLKQYKIFYSVALRMTPLLAGQLHKIGDMKLVVINDDRNNNINYCILEFDWLSKTVDIGNPSIEIENILAPIVLFNNNLYYRPEIYSINSAGREMPDEVNRLFDGPVKLDINILNPYFQDVSNKLKKIKRKNLEVY